MAHMLCQNFHYFVAIAAEVRGSVQCSGLETCGQIKQHSAVYIRQPVTGYLKQHYMVVTQLGRVRLHEVAAIVTNQIHVLAVCDPREGRGFVHKNVMTSHRN